MAINYEQVVNDAQAKLKELTAKRAELDREIAGLARIIEGAKIGAQKPSEWNPDDPHFVLEAASEQETAGVTETVRLILQRANMPLQPTEIRNRLESLGTKTDSSKKLLIYVHKILKRLFDAGEIEPVTLGKNIAYRYLSDMDRVMLQAGGRIGIPLPKNPHPARKDK